MILKRYGRTVSSVEPHFDSRAFHEIGFRRDGETTLSGEEFEEAYVRTGTREVTASAEGEVQDRAEQETLDALEEALRELEGSLAEDEVLLVASGPDVEAPRTRFEKEPVGRPREDRFLYRWSVDPPLTVDIYRKE